MFLEVNPSFLHKILNNPVTIKKTIASFLANSNQDGDKFK